MALIDQIHSGSKEPTAISTDGISDIQAELKTIRKAMEKMQEPTFGVYFHRIVTAISGAVSIICGLIACDAQGVYDDEITAFGVVCIAIGAYLLSKLLLPWRK